MAENSTPSQRALDHASQLAGFKDWVGVPANDLDLQASIEAHALTLDQLWERCPDLAPKTKGELFAEEMCKRARVSPLAFPTMSGIAAQMIDENWEPRP